MKKNILSWFGKASTLKKILHMRDSEGLFDHIKETVGNSYKENYKRCVKCWDVYPVNETRILDNGDYICWECASKYNES